MSNLKYRAGDCVRIKSLDWYNENKDKDGIVELLTHVFVPGMSQFCGKVVTIEDVFDNSYNVKEDSIKYSWTDEMIEGLVKEETKNWADTSIPDGPYTVTYDSPSINDSINKNVINNEINLPNGYIFKDENGNVINATKIVLEKKKKEYPKIFEECVHVLEGDSRMSLEQMNTFRRLIDARNAYWKIAGDWKPDYDSGGDKFGIVCYDGIVTKTSAVQHWERHLNKVLDFPTAEMRDAFYENFKELIEICKELL